MAKKKSKKKTKRTAGKKMRFKADDPRESNASDEALPRVAPLVFVAHPHVRILREALARVTKCRHLMSTRVAMDGLKRYSEAVAQVCEHPDTTFLPKEKSRACLDCGRRFLERDDS